MFCFFTAPPNSQTLKASVMPVTHEAFVIMGETNCDHGVDGCLFLHHMGEKLMRDLEGTHGLVSP